jgi:type I restriction enzyme S subunit
LALIKLFPNHIDSKFLIHLINSPLVQEQVKRDTRGVGNKNWVLTAISNTLLAIPPLVEQKRIVSKIEEIMPIADKYEKSQEALDRLNTEIYDKLKKSVLQEAIQGKLVPQDTNDEPASILLERIKEEKAKLFKEGKLKKKDLVDSVIFKGEDNKYYEKVGSQVSCIDEEIPFEIPANWEWVRLGTLYQHNTGKALNGANQKGVAYEYITTSNLYWNYFVLDKLRTMPFTDEELEKCTVKKGDLLVCEGGDIGRSAIWNFDYDIRIQNHIHRLRPYVPLCSLFFYYALYLYKHIGLIGGKGIGIQGLSSNALHRLLLPLPSIAEQERIVDKIEFVIASIMRN